MRSEVQLLLGPPLFMDGALAQLGERLLCKHQVIGSIPIGSTTSRNTPEMKTRDPARCAGHAGAIPPLFDIVNGFLIDAVAHCGSIKVGPWMRHLQML